MSARIDLFYFEAGGGHRAAATALESVIAEQERPWKVRLVNLQDLFDSVDPLHRLTGLRVQNFYNLLIRKGWTLGSAQLLKLLQTLIWLFHPLELRLLRRFWREDAPDMVISVIPNFNRVLCQAFREVKPGAPFVTTPPDLADYPP
ncbi:MAG: galactosyldiacylglycerol synthase, partial [Planctomycetes bacterium]|nr:galactosyldiacylglycerol synthase [Planctomycetota bacterium]